MRLISFFFALSLIQSYGECVNYQQDLPKWLLGTWENKTPSGSIYESWIKLNSEEFSGKSFSIKERDTILFETIQLINKADNIYYIPTVNGQNNNQAVSFKMNKLNNEHVQFENPEHDFPQIIEYRRYGSDSLVATISGVVNGSKRTRVFPMKKVN